VPSQPAEVSRILRWSLFVAAVSAALCWVAYRLPPPSTSDFDQMWVAARALVVGTDPYAVVPTTGTHYPFFYPLPSALVALPLAPLSLPWARVVWAGVSGAVFTSAALRYGRGLPAALLSASFLNAVVQGQWSPLMTAAAVVPALSWIWVAKPSVGAAMFAGFPNRRAVIGGLLLAGLAFIALPSWPARWLEALRDANHVLPVQRPGGFLLLFALLRWREPEARVLAGLACVPQTIGLYETLPLFLIPRTRWQGYALAGLSYVAAFAQAVAVPRLPGMTLDATLAGRWPYLFALLYLPALVLLLLPRRQAGTRDGEPAGATGGPHSGM